MVRIGVDVAGRVGWVGGMRWGPISIGIERMDK